MMKEKKLLDNIKTEIKKLEDKKFNVLFFVYDTKGTPSGSLTQIYRTAYYLKELGYSVKMLHQEKDFVGVGDWMGEKYANLPHHNIEKEFKISPSDFLFIPEIFSNVMSQTKDLGCKRIVLLQNYDFVTDQIPFGASWDTLKMGECIATTDALAERIKEVFPRVKTHVVHPCVDTNIFQNKTENKKLIVNIITKDGHDLNSIVKNFKWKYPIFGFVPFRNVNGIAKEDFAHALDEAAITVWNDPFTDFGVSALEAMACGNIVIGKIPEGEPEWLMKDGAIRDNGLWCYNSKDIHGLVANAIQSFISDEIPTYLNEEMKKTVQEYSEERQYKEIEDVYVNKIFANRLDEFKKYLQNIEENKVD